MQKYLITSPDFYTQERDVFKQRLEEQIQKYQPDFILFRDKENKNYAKLATIFVEVCKKHKKVKYFIHSNARLAKEVDAIGVHLTSSQIDEIKDSKSLHLEVIVSTHTFAEAMQAQKLGADYITYSPIFPTPNKGMPKGVDNLRELISQTEIKIFALGGVIDNKEVDELKTTNVYGFASIRYFQ